MISIVLAGRNDDYGAGFQQRLLRAAHHNAARLAGAGVEFEFVLGEWNPVPGKPLLADEFVRSIPGARAVVISRAIHEAYSINPSMQFYEMAAKNAALRRCRGELIMVTNADILLGDDVVSRLAHGSFADDCLYRAHRIDVSPNHSWDELRHSANQLISGEGSTSPCWYLGGGGDFCVAARSLWTSLGGFNERVRFSTRALDWQFYLSAAARGCRIEFIGDVYHLDHAGGFRNTPPSEAEENNVHFGGPWDIEFGLPVRNPDEWGFAGVRESVADDSPAVIMLDGWKGVSVEEDRTDRLLADWLRRPNDRTLQVTAALFDVICQAHARNRRLICRISSPQAAVALAGYERVAREHGISIHSSWIWPQLNGYTLPSFQPEPEDSGPDDWIVQEENERLELVAPGGSREPAPLPRQRVRGSRPFDPVMCRRLLRACLSLQRMGARRIGIYGAGSHTENVLRWGLPDRLEVGAIIVSRPGRPSDFDIPVVPASDLSARELDAVLLSSASFEPEMAEAAKQAGLDRVIRLYGDWPPEYLRGPILPAARGGEYRLC